MTPDPIPLSALSQQPDFHERLRELIADELGVTLYRFCGDFDSDGHEPYADPDALKHMPPHIQAADTMIRCRKCDGHRWASTISWERHGKDIDTPNWLGSADAALTLCERLRGELWGIYISTSTKGKWRCVAQRYEAETRYIWIDQPTLPLAISLAFLLARGRITQ